MFIYLLPINTDPFLEVVFGRGQCKHDRRYAIVMKKGVDEMASVRYLDARKFPMDAPEHASAFSDSIQKLVDAIVNISLWEPR